MRKADVTVRREYGAEHPAVNVKVDIPFDIDELVCHVVAVDYYHDDADAAVAWALDYFRPGRPGGDNVIEGWFGVACEHGWELVEDDARSIFGEHVKVYSEGRSGGWAVVEGLPPFDSWDAIMLSKWAKFAGRARATADDVPADMVRLVMLNVYERELEERAERERADLAGIATVPR